MERRADATGTLAPLSFIVGADENGTGCFAGPLVATVVLAPEGWRIPGLDDSKKLSPKRRWELREQILAQEPFIRSFVEWRSAGEIDRYGMGAALKSAYAAAIARALEIEPNARIVIDGTIRIPGYNHESIPKADGLIPAVSAASIIGKTSRDHWMTYVAHTQYPLYDLAENAGYGSEAHRAALALYGPCPLHRQSYAPIREYMSAHFPSSKAA